MSIADYRAQNWLRQFLADRGLEKPSGKPLYNYCCTPAERASLQKLLAGQDLAQDDGRFAAAAFALFAAEQFRVAHEGGAWTWMTVLAPLNLTGSTALCEPIKTRGLLWWRRPTERRLNGRSMHLFTLVAEGGFPTGLLSRNHGAVYAWLTRLQGFISSHDVDEEQAAQVAEAYSALIPEALRSVELFALAAELTLSIKALQRNLGTTDPALDPILQLHQIQPHWRESLPIQIDDDGARTLLRGLIRATSVSAGAAEEMCRRVLVPEGEHWRAALQFEEAGRFRVDQLPTSVRTLLDGDVFRGRLIAAGELALVRDGEVALIERNDEAWGFRKLLRGSGCLPFPLDKSASLMLRVGAQHSVPFVMTGGTPILDDVLVFREVEEEGVRFVGTGSRSVREETLLCAIDPSSVTIALEPHATFTPCGSILGSALSLFRLQGNARLSTSDGLNIRLCTQAAEQAGMRVQIAPRPTPVDVLPGLASAGLPTITYAGGLNVAKRDIRWRLPGSGGTWYCVRDAEPLGAAHFVVERNGETIDRFRATIIPQTATVEKIPRNIMGGEIRLHGFRARRLSIRSNEGLVARPRRDGDGIAIEVVAPPAIMEFEVAIEFVGGGEARLCLPVPRVGVAFVDAAGAVMPRGAERAVDGLAGIRALADGGRKMTVELRARPPVPLAFVYDVGENLSLSALATEFKAMLAETSDSDATIVLQSESARLDLRRYGFSLVRGLDGLLRPDRVDLPLSLDAPITAVAYSLTAPQAGESLLWSGIARDLPSLAIASPDLSTPWLCWVEHRGRALSRPGVLPGMSMPPDADAFTRCAFLPGMEARKAAMAEHLKTLASDPCHDDWARLRTSLKICQGRVPLAALDWFTVLAQSPQALAAFLLGAPPESFSRILDIEQELPFLWEAVPAAAWINAAQARRKGLEALLGITGHELITDLMAEGFRALHRERPHLGTLAVMVAHSASTPFTLPKKPPLEVDPVQELLRRNADRQWPSLDAIPLGDNPALARYARHTHAVIMAPHVAAAVMAGCTTNEAMLLALRSAKRFDQTYFEAAFAAPPPDARSSR